MRPEGAAEGSYLWKVDPAERFDGLPGRLYDSVHLGASAEAYTRALFAQCTALEPGQHLAALEGIGEQLWERTPECFRKAYWAMRDRLARPFTIQFITDDPFVPWELMRPVDADGDRFCDVLALEHPVARWIASHEGELRGRLPAGRMVTVAPRYRAPDDLPEAQAEADRLADRYRAVRIPGTRTAVTRLLHEGLDGEGGSAGEPVAVLHFAGHGEFAEQAADASRILLEDGPLTVVEVGNQRVRLGARHRTLVIFNACEVGSTGGVLGAVGGWAEAFSRRRFGGFLAPLWPVFDEDAAVVVDEVLEAVLGRGEAVATALWQVRAKYGAESPTFFAYLYFGDVMARVTPAAVG
jgi:hypothetical protein